MSGKESKQRGGRSGIACMREECLDDRGSHVGRDTKGAENHWSEKVVRVHAIKHNNHSVCLLFLTVSPYLNLYYRPSLKIRLSWKTNANKGNSANARPMKDLDTVLECHSTTPSFVKNITVYEKEYPTKIRVAVMGNHVR